MSVSDYILDFLEANGAYANTAEEYENLCVGIKLYLTENGIESAETGEYYLGYVKKHLAIIDKIDLKNYFLMYPVLSRVAQIAITYKANGFVQEECRKELYSCMKNLYLNELGDKYVPAAEVKEILGKHV